MISLNRDFVTNIYLFVNLVKILFLPPIVYAFIAIYKSLYAITEDKCCNRSFAKLSSNVTLCK